MRFCRGSEPRNSRERLIHREDCSSFGGVQEALWNRKWSPPSEEDQTLSEAKDQFQMQILHWNGPNKIPGKLHRKLLTYLFIFHYFNLALQAKWLGDTQCGLLDLVGMLAITSPFLSIQLSVTFIRYLCCSLLKSYLIGRISFSDEQILGEKFSS